MYVNRKTVGIQALMDFIPKSQECAEEESFGSSSPRWHINSGLPTRTDGGLVAGVNPDEERGHRGSKAANFNFNNGNRNWNNQSNSNNNRALPVRSGK